MLSTKPAPTLLPAVSLKAAAARLPETTPAKGERRGRVDMLLGCVQRVFFDDVNQATAGVLAAKGFEVFAPRDVRCCGGLMLHSGCEAEALDLAKRMIEAFEKCDHVTVNAAELGAIPELELIEPAEWEICCGSAGIYNLLQPDAGRALGRRKAENVLATGAEAVASGNPGCTLQITAHLRDQGRPLPIYHPMELLDRSIGGGGRP